MMFSKEARQMSSKDNSGIQGEESLVLEGGNDMKRSRTERNDLRLACIYKTQRTLYIPSTKVAEDIIEEVLKTRRLSQSTDTRFSE